MAANGTGVEVGGTGVIVGLGELTAVSVDTTCAAVTVGTGLEVLQAEINMGNRQIAKIMTRRWRRLIRQIIPANRF
jgi:hypothetical protein